mmetsp:Transcript_10756/g.23362  ORF Transcript_10756/g.23362 Transcript_10756/m.23362 type:complete len:92 (+) Transcript_10756:314-589(+)
MGLPTTPSTMTTKWTLRARSYWIQRSSHDRLRKTKEALFIRAANPGRELTQLMNQDHGYTISKCWDWAIPEIRRKMEWAQRKKNPRPSDHS